jgi:hypothetical protein
MSNLRAVLLSLVIGRLARFMAWDACKGVVKLVVGFGWSFCLNSLLL